jgi:hypothetical protein
VAPRIGEQLVRDGLITSADLKEGLALARERGIRLASALVILGRLSADDASRALAEQHGVPAALSKHLEGRDLALATLLPPGLGRSLAALPLAVSRGHDAVVVCVRDPGPLAAAAVERALGRSIVLAVAVESLLLPLIAETYPEPADASDDFDVDLETDASEPLLSDGFDASALQLVDLDDRGVSRDLTQITSSQRITSIGVATTDGLSAAVAEPSRARRNSSPFAVIMPSADAASPGFALDPALVRISAADSRDQVIEALLGFLRHRFDVAVVFVVRDGLALGQVGFGNGQTSDAIGALVMPLTQPSVLRVAHERVATYVGGSGEASMVQDRMFRMFGGAPRQLVVVPVSIKDRVVNLLYAHGPRGVSIEDAAGELGTLAEAAEEAFVRIILETKSS